MEIITCEINGVEGYKCGENGVCYIGTEARQRALKDQASIRAEEFRKHPAPLPKNDKPIKKTTKKL